MIVDIKISVLVNKSSITGKGLIRIWPLNKIGIVK